MNVNFKEVVLNNYGGIKLRADIEEKENDIIAAILYNDHGDDFLYVITKEQAFEYGWWLNRNPYPDYDEVNDSYWTKDWLRYPVLDGEYDKNHRVSNDICWDLDWYIFDDRPFSGRGYGGRLGIGGQFGFDKYYASIKKHYESNTIYHHKDYKDTYHLLKYLETYDLVNEENLKKLGDLKVFYRIDAIDGSSAKQNRILGNDIYGDSIKWIYYKGKTITKKFNKYGIKVKSTPYDEWGVGGFRLNTNQFLKGV